ncbi:MAG: YggS family pyridoxal phosphate-dependent enzyme [Clostridia bacterium]|nr:YggS family pyridoxal phosphate-dependent enzyme [Clostridia bacterium]
MELECAELIQRVDRLREALVLASRRFGAPPLLLPVTKGQPPQRINQLAAAGISQIGESKAQEWRDKSGDLLPGFELHWIGRLQTNKIKYIIDRVCLVHSLDRPALAQELGRCAERIGRRVPALVQVNVAGEAQKAGLSLGDLPHFLREYGGRPGLWLQGLMAIMPDLDENQELETLRPYFRLMRETFESMAQQNITGVQMRHLSMGMSADYIVAAQEGATIVRVGSAIFGTRQ